MKIILYISILSIIAPVIQSCGGKKANLRTGAGSSATDPEVIAVPENADGTAALPEDLVPTAPGEGSEAETAAQVRLALVDYGYRDFSQVYYTMAAVTGVDPNLPAMVSVYEAQILSLPPVGNDIKAFVAAHQSSIFKMGVEFCHVLFEDATLRGAAVPGFDFSAAVATAFSGESKAQFIMALLNRFWGSGLSNRPDYQVAATELATLIDEILADSQNLNTIPAANRTRNVAKGVCAAAITALPLGVI